MDGNKDEALKCFKIGHDAFEVSDQTRALKFITKALWLDPSLAVGDFLSKLEDQSGEGPTKESSSTSTKVSDNNNNNSSARHRVLASGPSTTSVAYTEEHISIVREIKRKKDYYEILGLEKSCTVEDVHKHIKNFH